jgi:hypothetical protein
MQPALPQRAEPVTGRSTAAGTTVYRVAEMENAMVEMEHGAVGPEAGVD